MDPTTIFMKSRSIIEAIDAELNQTRLLELFFEAICFFDHQYQQVHNKLVVGGADRTLVKCLEKAVADPDKRKTIDPICNLLLMLYRCGDDQFQDSVAIVGGDLFPTLLAILFLQDTGEDFHGSAQALMWRLNAIKLDLRDLPWSHSLLDLFQEIVDAVDPSTHLEPLRVVMTWLVEGLLLPRENNKCYLMQHPGIFDSVVTKFSNTFRPGCVVNINVSKFMKILALTSDNRHMIVLRPEFFRLLFLLSHDECVEIKQEVLETLTLTCLERMGRKKTLEYLDLRFVDFSVGALDNATLLPASLQFIDVLSQHVQGKILLSKRPGLLAALTKKATFEEIAESLPAAQTVVRFAKSLSVNHGKGDLLDAILSLCKAKDARIRYEATHALLDQCKSRPGCSFFIAHVSEAIAVLAKLVVDLDSEVRALATEIVLNLSSSPLNVRSLIGHINLLNALAATATEACEPSNGKAQQHAVLAILHIAVHHKSIKPVPKQNIFQSFSDFESSDYLDQVIKEEAIRGVACLSSYI